MPCNLKATIQTKRGPVEIEISGVATADVATGQLKTAVETVLQDHGEPEELGVVILPEKDGVEEAT